jgi:hypothetical protein
MDWGLVPCKAGMTPIAIITRLALGHTQSPIRRTVTVSKAVAMSLGNCGHKRAPCLPLDDI